MYFEQFYLTCLSPASYMLGSQGMAGVVDPQRDVEIYLEEAAQHGLSIEYVIETHLHDLPGSIQIGLAGQYASWAAIALSLDQEIVLVSEDRQKVAESRLRLTRVGIEKSMGYLEDGIAGWSRAGLPILPTSQISVEQLQELVLEDPKAFRCSTYEDLRNGRPPTCSTRITSL
jgi:hypothetical protein